MKYIANTTLVNHKIESIKKPPFDYALEALRGIAALFVVLSHSVTNGPTPDPHPHVTGIWKYSAPGHLSVIIFFMLSGYVIGITNTSPLMTRQEIGVYLKKRFIRLYPLYLLTILMTVAIAAIYHTPYSIGTVSGYLLFLQGLVVKVPDYNQPIWSLGYEIAYYILFILVSARQWQPRWVALFFLMLGLVLSKLQIQPIVLAAYAYGAVFWFIGLHLAKLPRIEKSLEFGTMLAFMVLMLSYERMNLLNSALQALGLDVSSIVYSSFFEHPISFSDLSYLLLCTPMLICFTNRAIPGRKWLESACFSMPGLYLTAYMISGKIKQPELFDSIVLPVGFYALSLLLYMKRKSIALPADRLIKHLVPLGGISYGLYIIHYPLFFVFHQVNYLSGTVTAFLLRLIIYLATVLIIGWVLEKQLQPWVRKKLN